MVAEICPDPHGVLWLWSLDWYSLRYSWLHLTFWGEESRFMISLVLIFLWNFAHCILIAWLQASAQPQLYQFWCYFYASWSIIATLDYMQAEETRKAAAGWEVEGRPGHRGPSSAPRAHPRKPTPLAMVLRFFHKNLVFSLEVPLWAIHPHFSSRERLSSDTN